MENEEDIYKIYVNKLMSSPQVDREVIKYLIYHELLHKNGYFKHDDKFRVLEWKYPNSEELDGFMDEMAIKYNLDILNKETKGENEVAEDVITKIVEEASINSNDDILSKDSDTQNTKKHKFCRNCGNKLPEDANFCDKCGNDTRY